MKGIITLPMAALVLLLATAMLLHFGADVCIGTEGNRKAALSGPGALVHIASLVLMAAAMGVLGGTLGYLENPRRRNAKNNDAPAGNGLERFVIGGVAAALLVPLFLHVIGSGIARNSACESHNYLVYMGFCLVAAFTSRGFIANVSNKALQESMRSVEQNLKQVEQTSEETLLKQEEQDFVVKVDQVVKPDAPGHALRNVTNELERFVRANPLRRTATILLGRLHEANNDLEGATQLLTRFLDQKSGLDELDKDYADVLYNRAAYYLKLWKSHWERPEYKEQAYRDLEESIRLSPHNKVDASDDSDFALIREEERFDCLGKGEGAADT